MNDITYSDDKNLPKDKVVSLYASLDWSSAEKPDDLMKALSNSHSVITAWHKDEIIGLGNALSDGHLVVYYPHLLIHPDFQKKGIGKEIVRRMKEKYSDFHQQILVADGGAIDFYEKCGFDIVSSCKPLWVYDGHDHD